MSYRPWKTWHDTLWAILILGTLVAIPSMAWVEPPKRRSMTVSEIAATLDKRDLRLEVANAYDKNNRWSATIMPKNHPTRGEEEADPTVGWFKVYGEGTTLEQSVHDAYMKVQVKMVELKKALLPALPPTNGAEK